MPFSKTNFFTAAVKCTLDDENPCRRHLSRRFVLHPTSRPAYSAVLYHIPYFLFATQVFVSSKFLVSQQKSLHTRDGVFLE
jgi:hypothetical protein